ncbi:hypothetical protein BN2476_490087 [Paraburkholderia piptadeniae]|uniref:Uncharacterized protein n=1 Tax=Paraburkholderia piptadeniae TaxID=1701573 RepID=A0A1N7SG84_9BURK|nr:hypothetical protein BN2476_490087 [Paraburkholderia piptadeniae]
MAASGAAIGLIADILHRVHFTSIAFQMVELERGLITAMSTRPGSVLTQQAVSSPRRPAPNERRRR